MFVHGLIGSFCDPGVFGRLAPSVCSAPDLAGYGSRATEDVTFEGQIDALRQHVTDVADGEPVHLVAHSIGAVYAFTFADLFPQSVSSLTSVEGNFSLADAFWSRSIAALDPDDARDRIRAILADPHALLDGDGIVATPRRVAEAKAALAFQPWTTVWRSAQGIVEATGSPAYESLLSRVFSAKPVHLIAGERSAPGWHVPPWARSAARSSTIIPDAGHLLMIERPTELANVLLALLPPTEADR